jgi:hypothetical protein
MRQFLISLVGLSLSLSLFDSPSLAQQVPTLVAKHGYADLVVTNGKVVSMDDRSITPNTPGHIYQAMAIKGKMIMALGTEAEMRRLTPVPESSLVPRWA